MLSASPVLLTINNCGKIATDSKYILKVHNTFKDTINITSSDNVEISHLKHRKVVINEQRQNKRRNCEKFNSKSVVIVIIGRPEFHVNQIDRRKGCRDEHQFHAGIIKGHISGHQVQVPCYIHHSKENLTLSRYTYKQDIAIVQAINEKLIKYV